MWFTLGSLFVAFAFTLVTGLVITAHSDGDYYQYETGTDLVLLALLILVLSVAPVVMGIYARRNCRLVIEADTLVFAHGIHKQRVPIAALVKLDATPVWIGSRWVFLLTYKEQAIQQYVSFTWRSGPWTAALLADLDQRGVEVTAAARIFLQQYDSERPRTAVSKQAVSDSLLWTKATTFTFIGVVVIVLAPVSLPGLSLIFMAFPLLVLVAYVLLQRSFLGPQRIETDGHVLDHRVWWFRSQVDLDNLVVCSVQMLGNRSVLLVGDAFGRRVSIPVTVKWHARQEWSREVLDAYSRSTVAPTPDSVETVRAALFASGR